MEKYYGYSYYRSTYYICPFCEIISGLSYFDFYNKHKQHLAAFSNKKKKTIFQSQKEVVDMAREFFKDNGQSTSGGVQSGGQSTSGVQSGGQSVNAGIQLGGQSASGAVQSGGSRKRSGVTSVGQVKQRRQRFPDSSAFQNKMKRFVLPATGQNTLQQFLNAVSDEAKGILQDNLSELKSIKVNFMLEAVYTDVEGEEAKRAFKTTNKPVLEEHDLNEFLGNEFRQLIHEAEESQEKNSGWTLSVIKNLNIRIHKYSPWRGSSYIILPDWIEKKKACVNVHNNDQYCFKYAILSKFISRDAQREELYRDLQHNYDFSCISFPPSFQNIEKFEKVNSISINIFAIDDSKKIYPLKVCKSELKDHRDLLLLNEGDNNHYVWIKSISRLVSKQISDRNGHVEVCKRCLTHFNDDTHQMKIQQHKLYCDEKACLRIDFPKDNYIMFKEYEKMLIVPIVIYCDFEAILHPIHGCSQNPQQSHTTAYQLHELSSFCMYAKGFDERPYLYRGPGAAFLFMKKLETIANAVENIIP